jgi:hypothetical protein
LGQHSGADIHEGNVFGKTALMHAAHYNLEETLTLLLARGADVTRRTNARESKAIDTGKRDVQNYLSRNRRLSDVERARGAGAGRRTDCAKAVRAEQAKPGHRPPV